MHYAFELRAGKIYLSFHDAHEIVLHVLEDQECAPSIMIPFRGPGLNQLNDPNDIWVI